jgi:hypothetical protein
MYFVRPIMVAMRVAAVEGENEPSQGRATHSPQVDTAFDCDQSGNPAEADVAYLRSTGPGSITRDGRVNDKNAFCTPSPRVH